MKISTVLKIIVAPLLGLIASCASVAPRNAGQKIAPTKVASTSEYAVLLDKYVTPGGVRYDDWSRSTTDLDKLEKVSEFYASHQAPEDEKEAFAWYLNAYNAWVLQEILSNWPNEGPFDASLLFFHGKRVVVAGEKMSLVHLENKVIRKKFSDARLHFALNCASESCPPLHDKPFGANDLDRTLQQLTKKFLNDNPNAIAETDDEIQLSKIFDWYGEDFGGRENLIAYINQYRDEPLSSSKKVGFLKYSWKLNKAK